MDEDARLPHHVEGTNDAFISAMEKYLKKNNVKLVSMGDDYLVSIPASSLFADQSPQITWDAYALLNNVACYLRQFRKIEVDVSAYTSQYGSTKREHALSLARANAVSNYLWSQGIDTRFVFAHGEGSDKPIVMKALHTSDHSPNARIEITFRQVVA
jgi:intracellular multiplication protein IcmN